MIETIPGIVAIILKICLNETEFEEYKEKHFSDYVIYAEYDGEDNSEIESCWYLRLEEW